MSLANDLTYSLIFYHVDPPPPGCATYTSGPDDASVM